MVYGKRTQEESTSLVGADINKIDDVSLNTEKFIFSTDYTVPKESLETLEDSHGLLKVSSYTIDFQQLPPTPPATPPDYSNDEIFTTSENLGYQEAQKSTIQGEILTCFNSTALPWTKCSPKDQTVSSTKLMLADTSRKKSKTPNRDKSSKNNLCNQGVVHSPSSNQQTILQHQCQQCSKIFKTKSNLNQHRNIVHQNVRHVCEACGKSFTHSGYRYHKLTAHRGPGEIESSKDSSKSIEMEVVKKFECNKCGKRFAQNSLLRKHVHAVHDQTNDRVNGGSRKFQCPYCPSQFKRKDHVDRHITHLHSIVPDAKLFECTFLNCGKRFQSAGRLQQHNKLHQDNRKHPCLICGKSILRKKNLSIHMITCHPNELPSSKSENSENFEVNKKEESENSSFNHSRNVLVSSSPQSVQKVPMKCLACDFTFVYPSKLAAHLSSYPDHYLIPQTYVKKSENLSKSKLKNASSSSNTAQTINSDIDNDEGINEKDLMIIDDFINTLLSCNKLN